MNSIVESDNVQGKAPLMGGLGCEADLLFFGIIVPAEQKEGKCSHYDYGYDYKDQDYDHGAVSPRSTPHRFVAVFRLAVFVLACLACFTAPFGHNNYRLIADLDEGYEYLIIFNHFYLDFYWGNLYIIGLER